MSDSSIASDQRWQHDGCAFEQLMRNNSNANTLDRGRLARNGRESANRFLLSILRLTALRRARRPRSQCSRLSAPTLVPQTLTFQSPVLDPVPPAFSPLPPVPASCYCLLLSFATLRNARAAWESVAPLR